MRRRTFLAGSFALLVAEQLSASSRDSSFRVAVIGHTGRGNYGHGLDTVWLRIPETRIVAVADANAEGLKSARKKLQVEQGYADYREMLQKVRPDIVAVCPRHPDQHCEMILAAIEARAKGIYVEKPFCRTLAEADQIAKACEENGTRLAVAHRNRYHPVLQTIQQMLDDDEIGNLLEIRGRGKGDHRGGAEDLWVLGSHVLNLMEYFGGKPQSCSAILRQDGEAVTRKDVRDGAEGLGPLAGDEVHARYEFGNGLIGYFDSIANDGTNNAGFGLQLVGSQGLIDINCDQQPLAWLVPGNPFQPGEKPRPWIPITTAGPGQPEPKKGLHGLVYQHILPARDLLESMRENRQPLCGVEEAASTVEMICAVFASHQQGGATVPLPLEKRSNALLDLR